MPVAGPPSWKQRVSEEHAMLAALVDADGLTEEEQSAFPDMMSKLDRPLSPSQRAWVVAAYERLGLGAEASQNLASSGRVPMDDRFLGKRHYESMALPKRPPGRNR